MARVIDFRRKNTGSAESAIYPPEVKEMEERFERELEALDQRVLSEGIDDISAEDMKKVDLISLKLYLLYRKYDLDIPDGR